MGRKPRFGQHWKLVQRFFEALLLLSALGQTRANHTEAPKDSNEDVTTRRRFLGNLAFACDHKKGGDTVTALGLQEYETGYTLWVASNADARKKMIPFVEELLRLLQGYWSVPQGSQRRDVERKVLQHCYDHSQKRIKEERSILDRNVTKCVKVLEKESTAESKGIINWLRELLTLQGSELCERAYEDRKSQYRAPIKQRRSNRSGVGDPKNACPFWQVWHYIGRIAAHARAPRELLEDYLEVQKYLEPADVRDVPIPTPALPAKDMHTTIDGVIGRIVSSDKKTYRDALADSERNLDTFSKIVGRLEDVGRGYNPRVHAEIQVLEHFHGKGFRYVGKDPYIACSKMACYCCALYMSNHPAKPIKPQSHQKVWDKWAPPLLAPGDNDPAYCVQREALQGLLSEIKQEVLKQLESGRVSPWHPDSTTGLTNSSIQVEQGEESDGSPGDDSDSDLSSRYSLGDFSDSGSRTVVEFESRETSPESDPEHELAELLRDIEKLTTEDPGFDSEGSDSSGGGAKL